MVSNKVIVSSACLALASKVFDPNDHVYDIEVFKEKRKMQKENGYLTKD